MRLPAARAGDWPSGESAEVERAGRDRVLVLYELVLRKGVSKSPALTLLAGQAAATRFDSSVSGPCSRCGGTAGQAHGTIPEAEAQARRCDLGAG